ncbi:MAG TPA: glycosyltransferase family 2 protein [bacterium]|nr:glycosyltransferase family 2 protein [bacterium]
MRISLVLLVRNEIKGLEALFDRIPFAAADEVFCVDGASTDGSIEFLQKKGIRVYGQEKKGRGEAFRVAFEKASGDAIVFYSPDGNEDPTDIPKFRPLLESGDDLVIANRMSGGGRNEEDAHFFKWRKWANQAFTLLAIWTWGKGKRLADSINGFRAITRKAWQTLSPDGPGYTIEYQTSIRALKKGLRIAEFPTRESSRVEDREGSPSFQTGLAFLKLYFKELIKGKAC